MKRTVRSLRILVTDTCRLAGLDAARSLGRSGYTVVVGHPPATSLSPTAWSRYYSNHVDYLYSRQPQFEFTYWLHGLALLGPFDAVLPITIPPLWELRR
jgi:hypothetical protein